MDQRLSVAVYGEARLRMKIEPTVISETSSPHKAISAFLFIIPIDELVSLSKSWGHNELTEAGKEGAEHQRIHRTRILIRLMKLADT